jgi:hypothetical protein
MVVAPIIAKGGKQPNDMSQGNSKFPIIAPDLPNIMARDTFMVLHKTNKFIFIQLATL